MIILFVMDGLLRIAKIRKKTLRMTKNHYLCSFFELPLIMKRFIILFISIFFAWTVYAQTYTLSGTVTDASTGETLIGATVLDTRTGKGTVTNVNGRYSLTLKADSVKLRVTYVGYKTQNLDLKLNGNLKQDFVLSSALDLKEVTITAERVSDVKASRMSAMEIPVEQIKAVPVLFGEADIVKAIQLLPGVQSGSEGSSGMYVRGGGPDENLFLLDGVPLYNVNHLGGFFSAFNADAVKNVTLYKGSFPARFGGRLSSVLDVTMNNGNDKELHGNASIGFLSAKFNLEGPIVKERTTFCLSARRTYADFLLQPLVKKLAETDDGKSKLNAGYYFYDVNAKVTHKFNDNSRLYGSFYWGADKVYGKVRTLSSLQEDEYMNIGDNWGNLVGSLRWNYVLGPKLFMNLTASYTQYFNKMTGGIEKIAYLPSGEQTSTMSGDYSSGIKDMTLRADFDYTPNPDHDVKFGGYFLRHWFTPEVANVSIDYYDQIQMNSAWQTDTSLGGRVVPANEIVAFAEDDWSINNVVKVNYGLHLSGFKVENSFYPSVQPRISGRVLLGENLSLKAGYAYMTQYMHLLSTTSISMSTDLWVPVTDRVEPMKSHQLAAGIFYNWPKVVDFSLEAYYKKMDNLIEYKDGASFFGSSVNWEDLVVIGEGWSYGVEFLAQRSVGKFTGWIGYTWSKTMHLFDREGQQLNGGEPFPAKYDRRHDFSVVASYKFNDKIDVSATWVFSTGNAATLATQNYLIASDSPDDYVVDNGVNSIAYVEGRNNFRMPNYHRMDLGANFHRKFKKCHRTINVSVYNLYNRKNPYMIYRSTEHSYNGYASALVQLSLFPILPSVAYTLYF